MKYEHIHQYLSYRDISSYSHLLKPDIFSLKPKTNLTNTFKSIESITNRTYSRPCTQTLP